jgi:uncharacterized protein
MTQNGRMKNYSTFIFSAIILQNVILNAKPMKSKEVMIWQGIYYHTMEHLEVTKQNGWRINATITGEAEGKPVQIAYEIAIDLNWNVTGFTISDANGWSIQLTKDAVSWKDKNGTPLTAFNQCPYIDLSLTPFTNTLPIKKLKLKEGESAQIGVVYVDLLNRTTKPAQQRYTYLGKNVYKYESLDSGFTSLLTVDDHGFVLEYPGLWQRIYPATERTPRQEFTTALLAPLAADEIPETDRLYDRLIGAWDMTIYDYQPDGSKMESKGEWIFHYILEGRAIQDVFIAPSRPYRTPGMTKSKNRYGSSIRVYYPEQQLWKIFWINPVNGVFNELTAKPNGNNIIQEGVAPDGAWMRWGFTNITNDSFRWYGEDSKDGGITWMLSAEFFGKRKK